MLGPWPLWGLQMIMLLSLSLFLFTSFKQGKDRVAEKDAVDQEQETAEEKLFLYLALWQLLLL